jgi:hypothetical protein
MGTEDIRHLVAAAGFIFRDSVHHHWTGEVPAIPPEVRTANLRRESRCCSRRGAPHDPLRHKMRGPVATINPANTLEMVAIVHLQHERMLLCRHIGMTHHRNIMEAAMTSLIGPPSRSN